MSAVPVPPLHDQEPPEEPVRRTRWKRILGWIAVGIGLLIVLVVVAVVVLLHSRSFHQYVLRTAQEKVSASLGSQVQARDFALHWSGISPTLDMYGVVLHGASPYENPPLLQLDHLRAAVRVTSLMRRQWYVDDVMLDRPIARVFVDKNGNTNLPKSKSSGQQSNTNVFDLGIRHAQLNNGEVYYNNRKSAMNADLHDVEFRSAFDTSTRAYHGTLSYRDGHLDIGTYNPIPHDLQAEFVASPTAFALQRAVLTSGKSQFVLTATLNDYDQPRIEATYNAALNTAEFRRIMKNPSVPAGVITLAGNLKYQSEPNRSMLDTMVLNGNVRSHALDVRTPTMQTTINDVAAQYTISNGDLQVRDMRARLLGGELTGTMLMRNLTGNSQSRLAATLRGVSLAELKPLLASSSSLRQVAISGTGNADVDASWGKTFDTLTAKANANLQGSIAPVGGTTPGAPNALPISSVIHALYSAPTGQITLTQSYVRTSQTSLTLNGTVSNRSALQVRLQSSNLHELETASDMFRTSTPGQPSQPLGLYGAASFVGAVRGSASAPNVTGELTASNLRVKGSAWRILRTNVSLSPSGVSLQNGQLQPVGRGGVTFDLTAGLRKWSFTDTSPIQVSLIASQLNFADLAKAAGLTTPVAGILNANVSIRGTQLNPVGQGKVSLAQAKVSEQPIQSANLNFSGNGNEVQANLAVTIPAGTARGTLDYFPKQQSYRAELQATGIRLDQLQAVKTRNMNVEGVLNIVASGQGTVQNPGLQMSVQIPKLTVQGQTINGVNLNATVANRVANIALDSEVINTAIRGRGTINLTGNYETTATLDTQLIPFAPLVAIYAPAQAGNITGQTELHATVRGPLKVPAQLDAHVIIPTLQASYKNTVQIGAASPVRIDYTNGVLALQRATIRGTDTELQVQGSIPVKSTQPMSLLLLGTVDLRLAQAFSPDITSSGQLRFDINSYGQRADPNVQGQVRIINASLATGEVPIGLQNGNGVLTLTKDRLNITQFSGDVGGGRVTASGGVVYRPSLQFDLAVAGRGMRFLYPQGVREALDTNLALVGTTETATLRGQVRLENLSFTPDFDLMDFIGQMSGETVAPPPSGFSQNLNLDVGVQTTSGLNLVSRTLSLQGTANLRVTGTAAQPVILGRVNLSGGDLIFSGNRYVIQGGTIDFANPTETIPNVNVAVNTTIQQYNIHLRFIGPADHLRTNYASDPSLPPSDIINLLAFGKTSEASAANPATPGNLGAESLIASGVASQVTSRFEKIAGISQLSVDPVLGGIGQGQNPGARITIQQRVTGSLFVTFATDLTSTQRQVMQIQYKVSPRLSVSGTRDQNGGFGFDARIHKSW